MKRKLLEIKDEDQEKGLKREYEELEKEEKEPGKEEEELLIKAKRRNSERYERKS